MLAKKYRFHGLNSLRPTYKYGKVARGPNMMLRTQLNKRRQNFRAAVVVSKKVNKSAVIRNRIRRRIYEVIRLNQALITNPHEFIITVFSDSLATCTSDQLSKEITNLLQKSGVIKQ